MAVIFSYCLAMLWYMAWLAVAVARLIYVRDLRAQALLGTYSFISIVAMGQVTLALYLVDQFIVHIPLLWVLLILFAVPFLRYLYVSINHKKIRADSKKQDEELRKIEKELNPFDKDAFKKAFLSKMKQSQWSAKNFAGKDPDDKPFREED
jgi:hypothetical protein